MSQKQIIGGVLALFVITTLGFLTYVQFSSDIFEGKEDVEFNMDFATVWANIINESNIPQRLPKIKSIELLSKQNSTTRWKAYTQQGDYLLCEATTTSDTTRELFVTESSFGWTTHWTYTLRNTKGGTCKLFISEKSSLHAFPFKLVLTFVGRHMLMREEIRSLKFLVKEEF